MVNPELVGIGAVAIEKICIVCKDTYTRKPKVGYSQWGKSRFCSAECKDKELGTKWIGRKHSEDTKIKISQSRIGKSYPKLSLAKKGKKHSEEHKKLIASSLKKAYEEGRKVSYFTNNKWQHSEETKELLSKTRLGDKNPAWKGGVTPLNHSLRTSRQYKNWRTSIFEKDNYSCVLCGTRNGNGKSIFLQADHIKPFSQFPELRFNLDNGRTLCLDCHKTTETYGYKAVRRDAYAN